MENILKKPSSGGEALFQKKGKEYFSKLAKEGWKKRRKKLKKWKSQQKSTL